MVSVVAILECPRSSDKFFRARQRSTSMLAPICLSQCEDASQSLRALSSPSAFPKTGEVHSGRTSRTGTPEQNVANRDKNHHKNDEGFGPAVWDKSSTNKDAIRGREQQNIDANGKAKSQNGTSGNAINGISDKNEKRDFYLEEAEKEFGH